MKIVPIASGSKGNCIYIENENLRLIVDAGISRKRIEDGLESLNVNANELDGILVTHEHSDHISGLGVLTRKYNIPIYSTGETLNCIKNTASLGDLDTDLFMEITPNKIFTLKGTDILPFSISHDAARPVAYRFNGENKSAAIATDMGFYDDYIVGNLEELDAILIESNHDVNMLQIGPYPYYLKQRIWGNKGHLSNESCGSLVNRIISSKLKYIILGHLSKENNLPEIAFETVRNEINAENDKYSADDISIKVASRVETSCEIEF